MIEIILNITLFIAAIILIIFWYLINKKLEELKKQKIDNRHAENRKEQLDQEIINREFNLQKYQGEYNSLNSQLAQLEKEYKSKQKIIQDAQQTIDNEEKIYQQRIDSILKEYSRIQEQEKEKNKFQKEQLEKEFFDFQNSIQEQKEILNQELDSLKSTHAATVEALRREEELKKNLDNYRIILSNNDKKDMRLLEDLKLNFSKPRVISMLIWQYYVQPLAKKKINYIFGAKSVCGIYKITNIQTEECYIGQAVDVQKRIIQHIKHGLDIDSPQGNKLYQSMKKYGIDQFTFELLDECKEEELDQKEKFFIETFNSYKFGFNSTSGNK